MEVSFGAETGKDLCVRINAPEGSFSSITLMVICVSTGFGEDLDRTENCFDKSGKDEDMGISTDVLLLFERPVSFDEVHAGIYP